jgi:hypothetical protein
MKRRPLSYKQQLFVDYYTGGNGEQGNCMAAMLKAGYSPKYAKHWNTKLLDNIGIKKAIAKKKAEIAKKTGISIELQTKRINEVAELALAEGDLRAVLTAYDQLNRNIGFYGSDNAQKQPQTANVTFISTNEEMSRRKEAIKKELDAIETMAKAGPAVCTE